MPTLIVDGDNLAIQGFYGLKNHFYKGRHIGAIFHFIDALRRCFEQYHLDKIVVFWDGEESSIQRKKLYLHYKDGPGRRTMTDDEHQNYNYQRTRVKQYLEELYVRQGEYKQCETDDCVAYYTQNSPNEKKIIYSSDRDLFQLLDSNTSLYNPSHRKLYNPGDMVEYDHQLIRVENVKLVKILCGDPSDNIYGIYNFGIKRLITLFPEIQSRPITIEEVREKGDLLFEQDKHNKTIGNLLTGVTKLGVFGEEFFTLNKKIIDLSEPLLYPEAKSQIIDLINEDMDTEGRSYKNTMKMMMEDGIFTVLPKYDDAWMKFLNPFLRLTMKEKNKTLYKFKK